MAYVTTGMRQKFKRDAQHERLTSAVAKNKEYWIEHPFEWHTKQTDKAVYFKTHGWVPKSAIAWKKGDQYHPWDSGHQDTHKFHLAGWIVRKKKQMQNESEHLMYRASTKHLRTYLNFMKMRTAQGLATPADEEMVKKAQKHYSTRLLHNVLTSKNIKENWEQVSDGAWINSDNTIAIAKTENGEIISLGKDGKLRKQWDTVEQAMKEEAPTNAAGGGAVAGIGISSPTIKNPPQAEPGVREKKRILKRFAGYFKKA